MANSVPRSEPEMKLASKNEDAFYSLTVATVYIICVCCRM